MAVRVPLWNDRFNRANGPIGSRYVLKLGNLDIVGNRVRTNLINAYNWWVWSGAIPNRQYVKVLLPTIINAGGGHVFFVALREQSGIDSAYWFMGTSGTTTNNLRIFRRDSGVLTLLAQASGALWAGGDAMEFEADGPGLNAIRNGASVVTATDANFVSGRAGLGGNLDSTGTVADVEFDDLEVGELRDAAPDFGSKVRSELANDPFAGADSADIGASWDVYTGASNLQRVSNRVRAGVENVRCLEGYNGTIPQSNQYCGVTVGPAWAAGGDFVHLWVRGAAPATAQSGYTALLFPGIPFVEIRRIDAGTLSAPLAGKDVQVVAGDTCYLEAEGQAVKLWVNSVKQAQLHDAANTYPTGRTGLGANVPVGGVANIEMDSFVMGELLSLARGTGFFAPGLRGVRRRIPIRRF